MNVINSGLRRVARAARVLRWTPWFALVGVVGTPANLLLGNHISVAFWLASMPVPGLALDLARMLNGDKPVWSRKEVLSIRGLAAVAIWLAVAIPVESVLDNLGGYHASNTAFYVNTDWSQLGDVASLTVALLIARQFLQWTRPKTAARAVSG